MSDNTNKNRAERRRLERLERTQLNKEQNEAVLKQYHKKNPGEIGLSDRAKEIRILQMQIRLLYLEQYAFVQLPDRMAVLEKRGIGSLIYGLTYWMHKEFPEHTATVESKHLVAILQPTYRKHLEYAEAGLSKQEQFERLYGEVVAGMHTDEVEQYKPTYKEDRAKGCPESCYTSGREPHVRHYHAPGCAQNDLERLDLDHVTTLLPGLVKVTYQGENHKLACIIIKDGSTCILWLNQGTHEYHLPMNAQLGIHKESPYQLVRMEEDQPVYIVDKKKEQALYEVSEKSLS